MLNDLFQILDDFGTVSVERLKQRHLEAGQKASGTAYNSFRYELEETEKGGFRLQIKGTDYSYFLEKGRGAGGFPPIDAIKQWIRDKGLASQFDKEYKLNSFAYLIGRKQAEQGSYLFRNKQTFNGTSDPISEVFNKARMEELEKKLVEAISIRIQSDIINEYKQDAD